MAFKMKGYSAGKGTGSALKQNYSPIDKMVLRKEAKMYQKKDGDKLKKTRRLVQGENESLMELLARAKKEGLTEQVKEIQDQLDEGYAKADWDKE